MADWQRDEVYQWEWQWRQWRLRTHSIKHVRSWIKWACKRYDIKPPTVGILPKSREYIGSYARETHHIRLKKENCGVPLALHEAAHAIAYKLDKKMDHGKLWLGIYIDLLVSARIAPRSALEASCIDEGLKFIKNANPNKVRKYLRKKKKARK